MGGGGSFSHMFCCLKYCSSINGSASRLIMWYLMPACYFNDWLIRWAGECLELCMVSLQIGSWGSKVPSGDQTIGGCCRKLLKIPPLEAELGISWKPLLCIEQIHSEISGERIGPEEKKKKGNMSELVRDGSQDND